MMVSHDTFFTIFGVVKSQKARKVYMGGERRKKVYPGFCPVGPLDVCNSFVGPGKRYADPLKIDHIGHRFLKVSKKMYVRFQLNVKEVEMENQSDIKF